VLLDRSRQRHVPDLGAVVGVCATRSEELSVGADGGSYDESLMAGLAAERLDLFARARVPELEGVVEACGDERLAVGTEGDGVDGFGVALERLDDVSRRFRLVRGRDA